MLIVLSILGLCSLASCHPQALLGRHNATNKNVLPGGCSGDSKAWSQVPTVCPYSHGGFHVPCSYTAYRFAADTCAALGLRLAAVNDANSMYALQTAQDCLIEPVWIASFNGLNMDPCMIQNEGEGAITAGAFAEYCDSYIIPPLCQEVPLSTLIISTSTTTTVSIDTQTTTTTVTRHPRPPPRCRDGKCNVIINDPVNKAADVEDKVDSNKACIPGCKDCDIVYMVPKSNLRVIRIPTAFDKAAAACAKYGWTLADVTTGMQSTIWAANQGAFPIDETGNYWVRSYEGVSGGRCARVFVDSLHLLAGYGQNAAGCNNFIDHHPLCQCGPPAPTGYGPYEGSVTVTTTTSTSTIESTVRPTVTQTVTVCQRCPESSSSSDSSSSDSCDSERHHRNRNRQHRPSHQRGDDADFF